MIRTIFPTRPAPTAFLAPEELFAPLEAVAAKWIATWAVDWWQIICTLGLVLLVEVNGYGYGRSTNGSGGRDGGDGKGACRLFGPCVNVDGLR